MNEYKPEEIIGALTVIKTTCESYEVCDNCPFCYATELSTSCLIHDKDPIDWHINTPTQYVWRALI